MGFRFKLPGGVRIGIGKKGVGVSVGVKGARVGVGPRGGRVNVGAGPIRYEGRISSGRRAQQQQPGQFVNQGVPKTRPVVWVIIVFWVVVIAVIVNLAK